MSPRKRYTLLGLSIVVCAGIAAFWIAARRFSENFEPYIRQQVIDYLEKRFDSDVDIASLQINMPGTSVEKLFRTRGRGSIVHVEATGIALRHKGRRDIPPLFRMDRVGFDVDLGSIRDETKRVQAVTLDGLDITIPPKGQRPKFDDNPSDSSDGFPNTGVIIEKVIVRNARLVLLPRKQGKVPLQFEIHEVRLEYTGKDTPMRYDAALTNAMPPGEILSKGSFGPWNADEPGETAVAGDYVFDNADLGVFRSIGGILDSQGKFSGSLSSIDVHGTASVPDFRLQISGNRVPLWTEFQVLVDGTDGDTILKPVVAKLGTTQFTTSGGVIKNPGDTHRSITLQVHMPEGNLQDLLRLAMKGAPFMTGRIKLNSSIQIPPLDGHVKEKLILDGAFEIKRGEFLKSEVQDKIDSLARRGQGQPKNEEIDNVVSDMGGAFHLEDQVIAFKNLAFSVPGAQIDLAGAYKFDGPIDFRGTMKLDAHVSETMTGWKRWVLKPVDPFFAKNGAGTFLRIRVGGTADAPEFGLDRGKKEESAPAERGKPSN